MNRSAFLKSAVAAVVVGALVAIALYLLSEWFFNAKNNQTLIKATELGNVSGGEKVFPVGADLPDVAFDLMSEEGKYVMSKDSNPVKIVNFWASWCEPCVEEFSSFARLLKALDGKVSFIGINEDKTAQEGMEFLKAFSSDFNGLDHVYFGYDTDKQLSNQYGILALPETFIVNRQGKLIRRVSGFEQWDSAPAKKYFLDLIEQNQKAM
jgi:thiol-disulfide isomerase/thioredoxin